LLGTDDLLRPEGPPNTIVFIGSQKKYGRSLRAVGLSFVPRSADSDEDNPKAGKTGPSLTLAIARDAGRLYDQLQFLGRLLVIASAAVVLLSLLISAIIVRKGLEPLNSLAAEIATITEEDLTTRITEVDVPVEVAPISKSINELMAQIEASFNRERKFNADVAHELRTPLAGMLSTVEVALTRDRNSAEYKQALADCLQIAADMQTIVTNLLMLTRIEAKQVDLETERISLNELVDSAWRPFADKAADRVVTFENNVGPDVALVSDRAKLGTVLLNLLCNAVEYVDDGGRIWITAIAANDSIEIVVSNTGCDLTAEQAERVFDCFWRADLSRSETGAHCGLGLALVQRLMSVLAGRALAEVRPGGIFAVRVILPGRA
jgi:signal transduction histidine kinase